MTDASTAARVHDASQIQLRALIEQAPDGIFVADMEGCYTFVNEAGCRMLGFSRDEIIGMTIFDLIPRADVERLHEVKAFLLSGAIHLAEWSLQRKDGTWLPVEVSAKFLSDGQWQGIVRDISARKAHEAERDAQFEQVLSERRWLQAALDALPVGVAMSDMEGRSLYNRRAEELFGMKLSPTAGSAQYADRVCYPDGRPVPTERLVSSRVMRDRETIVGEECVIRRPDGSEQPILGSAAPILDDEGRMIGGVGAFQDISERLRAEEIMRNKQRLLRGVIDLLPVGVWIADASGRIVDNNPAADRIWGGARYVPVAEFGQYKGWWLQSGEPIAAEEWALARALQKGETSTGELVRIQCFDGTCKTIINSAAPLRDERGEICGAIVVNEDITSLQETEAKLRASEQLFRTVFDLLPVGLWIADREGTITLSNPAGDRIWQGTRYVGPERFHEYTAWWLDSGKRIAPEDWGIARAIRCGETSRSELIRVQCFDGSHKTVINWAAPLRSDTGEITGAIAVNEDITSLQQTQEQLRTAVRDREDILAVVTHDLRNPISVVTILTAAIEERTRALPNTDAIRELTTALRGAAQRMSGLVEDLLAVAMDQNGRSMLKLAPVAPSELLARATEAARTLLEETSLTLEVRENGDLPTLMLDSERILRVFANLLDNARKYTHPPGRILVTAESVSGGVQFSVSNSGEALPADQLETMFQRFWQSAREDRSGAGLGLSICRSIVEAHGGSIWAEPAEGERVRVSFVLPRSAASR